MKNINQIEKALEVKCKQELTNIVSSFISDLYTLDARYGNHSLYNFKQGQQTVMHMSQNEFERALRETLFNAYGTQMLSKKTEELLAKLDLI